MGEVNKTNLEYENKIKQLERDMLALVHQNQFPNTIIGTSPIDTPQQKNNIEEIGKFIKSNLNDDIDLKFLDSLNINNNKANNNAYKLGYNKTICVSDIKSIINSINFIRNYSTNVWNL